MGASTYDPLEDGRCNCHMCTAGNTGYYPYSQPDTAAPYNPPWQFSPITVPLGSELDRLLRLDLTKEEEPVNEVPHEFATEEGQRLIGGARMEYYGPPQNNLNDIGETWTTYAKRALEAKGRLDGTDVSAMMVIMKVIRQARGYHRDSTVDIVGYAGLMEVLNDPVAFERFVKDAAEQMDEDKRAAFLEKFLGDS